MKYREFGKTGAKVSVLGFGCMRLPLLKGSEKEVDFDESLRMVRYGIDNGINYIDTAWPYHNGTSEGITGRILADGYREKVYLATKLPSWLVTCREDMDSYLDKQLERLNTDYIDFYLIHSLNKDYWPAILENGVIDFIEKAKAAGKIKHIGFSFHDDLPIFKEIVDAYDWEFCQIQYNFMDTEYQAGLEGLEYAAAKGLGIIVMEPLRGGTFLKNISDDIEAIWKSNAEIKTPADAALRWVWNNKDVSLLLSGMSTMQQVVENLDSADSADAGAMGAGELAVIEEVRRLYDSKIIAPCTNCKYCMPCPAGVDIPENLSRLNNTSIYNDVAGVKISYNTYFDRAKHASNCVECGQCEEACPQHIPIIEKLKQLDELMA